MIPQRQVDEARRRHALSALIGRDIALKRVTAGEWSALCPFHKERTPSFTVSDGKSFYHCFGCGAHGDAIAWRMQQHGETFHEAVEFLLGETLEGDDRRTAATPQASPMRAPDLEHAVLARDVVWNGAEPIDGTPGKGYFVERGITMPLPATLRYSPRCLRGPRRGAEYLPAVVCAVEDLAGVIVAVHRIYLEPSTLWTRPQKVLRGTEKALLGHPGAGSIRLAPAAPSIASCEGVETGLSIMQRDGVRVWSAIYAGRMKDQAWPPIVEAVYRYADRDKVVWKPGPLYGRRPGEYWAERACAADRAAGRRTRLVVPRFEKADANDLLQEVT